MARGPTVFLGGEARAKIREALDASGKTRASLAREAEVDGATITRLFGKDEGHVEARTVQNVISALRLDYSAIVGEPEQLELEIDHEFKRIARQALDRELDLLKTQVGKLRGVRVTGVVGVELHGATPEKQVFHRVFPLTRSA